MDTPGGRPDATSHRAVQRREKTLRQRLGDWFAGTGLGEARNLIVVRAGQSVIAVAGEYGTLSEIAFALKMGKQVVGLGSWRLLKGECEDHGIMRASSASEAVDMALQATP